MLEERIIIFYCAVLPEEQKRKREFKAMITS
jgi:hypothetical protein